MEMPNNQVEAKITGKKVLLDIFVSNTEDNKEKVNKLLEKLQKQVNHYKTSVSVIFYMDKGEKTPEEKEAWFLQNTNSQFYIVVTELTVKPDFVKQALMRIKNLSEAVHGIKNFGIKKYKTPTPEAKEIKLTKVQHVSV